MSGPISRPVPRRPFMPHVSLPDARAGDIVPSIHANGQASRQLRLAGLPPLRLLTDGFRDLPGLAVLEGGSDTSGEGRWSYLAADPVDMVRWTARGVVSEVSGMLPGNGFSALETTVPRGAPTASESLPPFPGGAIGYIAYDAAYALEDLPGRCPGPAAHGPDVVRRIRLGAGARRSKRRRLDCRDIARWARPRPPLRSGAITPARARNAGPTTRAAKPPARTRTTAGSGAG